jgi:hypothetical protein
MAMRITRIFKCQSVIDNVYGTKENVHKDKHKNLECNAKKRGKESEGIRPTAESAL